MTGGLVIGAVGIFGLDLLAAGFVNFAFTMSAAFLTVEAGLTATDDGGLEGLGEFLAVEEISKIIWFIILFARWQL